MLHIISPSWRFTMHISILKVLRSPILGKRALLQLSCSPPAAGWLSPLAAGGRNSEQEKQEEGTLLHGEGGKKLELLLLLLLLLWASRTF